MIPIYDLEQLTPEQILNRDIRAEEDVSRAVDEVIERVRRQGDKALLDYTKRFDGVELTSLAVTEEEIEAGWNSVDAEFRTTLAMAAENIRRFHEQQVHRDFVITDTPAW